jgi:superfamily II DNA or RNA helicase
MKFKVSEDKKFIVLIDSTQLEIDQLQSSMTKKLDNYFIMRKKFPHWDGEISFIDKYNRVPIGLWGEVQNIAKQYYFHLEIEGSEVLTDPTLDEEDFKEWIDQYFEEADLSPYEYQIEAAIRAMKFRFCTEEISTSGGKTLIAFMIFRYLCNKKKIKKMLYVVPNIGLVTQTEEKFYEYEERCKKKIKWKSECIYSGARKEEHENIQITFGTYQSLVKKDIEFFSKYDAVLIDETHHASNNSIKTIIVKSYNSTYRIGLSGTLPKEGSCQSFTIQAYLGPKVYVVYASDLIDAGNATPVHVIGIELDYLDIENKKKLYELRNVSADEKDGAKLLTLEKNVARENRKRLVYICETIAKMNKNTIVMFADIQNEYGRNIYNWLRENTDKTVYYIDGGTKVENRDYYKKQMEEQENIIIVASTGTFSEGIDILNVHNIHITESHKSEYIVRQILGRGMRLLEGKEKINVFDYSDNYSYGSGYQKDNYLMRHAKERERIYKEKRFPYKRFKVKL